MSRHQFEILASGSHSDNHLLLKCIQFIFAKYKTPTMQRNFSLKTCEGRKLISTHHYQLNTEKLSTRSLTLKYRSIFCLNQ